MTTAVSQLNSDLFGQSFQPFTQGPPPLALLHIAQSVDANNLTTGGVVSSGGTLTVSGGLSIASGGVENVLTGGNFNVSSGGTASVLTGGSLLVGSGGTETVQSGGVFNLNSGAVLDVLTGAIISVASGGTIALAANGIINGGTQIATVQESTSGFVAGVPANGLTAAGTSLAGALALTAQYNHIATCGSGAGVALPLSTVVSGGGVNPQIWVCNDGASACKVYGQSGDTLDGSAGTAGVSLGAGHACFYTVVGGGTYVTGPEGGHST